MFTMINSYSAATPGSAITLLSLVSCNVSSVYNLNFSASVHKLIPVQLNQLENASSPTQEYIGRSTKKNNCIILT